MTALRPPLSSQTGLARFSYHLRLSKRPFNPTSIGRNVSGKAAIKDKTRVLEKPARFNPPSHPSRRVFKPRNFPGPRPTESEAAAAKTRRYPNMMPPEGSLMHDFLTNRRYHVFITLGTLFFLAFWSMRQSFLNTTIYRDQLPESSEFWSHPFRTWSQFWKVYKLHVAYESEKVTEQRRAKLDDAAKRQEFLREHGVEPGFLTGSWMDKFGTVEADKWKAERAEKAAQEVAEERERREQDAPAQEQEQPQRRERKKVKMWFGIW